MDIIAYTLPGCSSCSTLKELFERASVEYKEVILRKDITAESFQLMFPGVMSFPYVTIDGERIGGLVDVAKLFVEKGLVSSNRS
jgi:glutaredoxin